MRTPLLLTALTALLTACGQPTPTAAAPTPDRLLGSVELPVSTADLSGQALTFREGDVTFTRTGPATVTTAGGYDYLRAQFQLTNTGSTPFKNLSLVAVAKQGNVGRTAIKSITGFGGISDPTQQATLARLSVPTHSVNVATNGQLSLLPGAEDLQFFSSAEVGALTTQPGWSAAYGSGDTPLNYGFVAQSCAGLPCEPTGFRPILPGGAAW